ncbi:hypothetical protein KW786_00655 [Candidatus Parcubacteria bacterium]|nr:hypothetical protein [Candidatus Parcubacteria bacterium]
MPYIDNSKRDSSIGGPKPGLPQKDVFGPRPDLHKSLEPVARPQTAPKAASGNVPKTAPQVLHPLPQAKDGMSKFAKGSVRVGDLEKWLKSPEGTKELAKRTKLNPYGSEYYKKLEEARNAVLDRVKEFGTVFDDQERKSLESESRQVKGSAAVREGYKKDMADGMVTDAEKSARGFRSRIYGFGSWLIGKK